MARVRRPLPACLAGACCLSLLLAPALAEANGQSTHLWITDHAITHVPEGPLKEFLTRPELRKMLDNGTMFPDGGYAINDPYAEIAHWEPFQGAYLEWLLMSYAPPYTGEGAEHLAFLLGMGSHGMADQVFDSLYGERVKAYDGAFGDFDTASDIIFMSNFEPMNAPSDWVPYELFDQLYLDVAAYDVDPADMMQGQNYLRIAVNSVAIFSQMPDQVSEAAAPFPWGSEHLLDEAVPGAPPCEGEVIARYWRALWALAHEQALPGPVLATIPADGGANHPTDSASLESWVSVVFARGLEAGPLSAEAFTVEAEGGGAVPLSLWHYYGQDSHVVHLQPEADLAADTVYTVTVDPRVATIHGEALEGYSFRFSTGPEGPTPGVPEWPPDHDPDPDMGGTDTGDGGSDTAGDTDTDTGGAGTSTGGDDTGSGGDELGGSEDEAGTGDTSDPGAEGVGGCACSNAADGRSSPGGLSLALAGLALGLARIARRRRRRA